MRSAIMPAWRGCILKLLFRGSPSMRASAASVPDVACLADGSLGAETLLSKSDILLSHTEIFVIN
jgi:hypothetical protein